MMMAQQLFLDTAMPLLHGVKRRLGKRWRAMQPTDKLVARLAPLLKPCWMRCKSDWRIKMAAWTASTGRA